jgi:hypothetical protein
MVKIDITLRSGKAERWQEVVDALEERLGYRPSRPEALGILMGEFEENRYR